ncbi:MAG: heavy metal translocating P-type ATPase metal-binding domain-containing protein [Verrucomicrobiales bacterium]|nr:heavy metal translocating P-type ATPase metal-binding domain-containing protein [Verrucomicrobiales bacterium]
MSQPSPELLQTPSDTRRSSSGCFHCGEACADDSFSLEGKSFCCFGCQTVFSLLHENGLEQFYELNSRPGIRIRSPVAAAKWAFLDDPVVQEKLFDYADKTQVKVTLHLPAIHCVACVWLLENLFKLHPGVGRSLVNFSRREAAITFAPDKIKFSELAALLASIGYEPELTFGALEKAKASPLAKKSWLQIGVAGFAFGNIMLMSLPFYFGLDSFSGPWFRNVAGWLGLAFALPVVTFSASDFWRAAWFSIRQRVLTMEVPITLGLGAIYAASIFEVLSHRGPGYCDSLTGLIFFLLCGRLFQKKTYDRLMFNRDYKGFFPLSVVRKTADGEESVAISRLATGDKIILRNGELLPADAKLISGEAFIDYSFVTGESETVACAAGSHLYAGGRQVGGVIEVETVKPVTQSYLATLWNNEAFRKSRDNDLDSLTNRYSKRFTKLVVGVALASAVFWIFRDATKALKAFTSVLIVACPCALALAAPLTHGTAQRILARLKFFLKNALVIERMAEVDTIVLDKTGTLTTADAGGVEFQSAECGVRSAELSIEERGWIASIARHSTHPNSTRITRSLPLAALPVANFRETPGCGIEGEIGGRKIQLGSQAWMEKCGVICSSRGDEAKISGGEKSETPHVGSYVYAAIDGVLRGSFMLENSLRPEVGKLIAQLGGRFGLALLSGDNEREAARFKNIFGGRAILKFNQSPADKLNFIHELQQRGRKVMMVGDGLNDAGALKQASVGVAVVEQIGVFSPASDVILDAAELPQLERVLQFSRRAAWIVRTGFVISAAYNVVGVSIAAAGLLSPIVCAILMPVSSITVVAFSCGATAWMGRKLQVKERQVASSVCESLQPSTFSLQPFAKEST